jgi:WD40 repeat protein
VTSSRTTRFLAPGSFPASAAYDVQALSFAASGSAVLTLTSSDVLETRGTDLRGISRAQVGSPSPTIGRFSPNRTQLAFTGPDTGVMVRDLSSGTNTQFTGAEFRLDPWFSLLAFSPDSRRLLASNHMDGSVMWHVSRPADPLRIMADRYPSWAGFKSDDEVHWACPTAR